MQRMKVDSQGNTYFSSKHKEISWGSLRRVVDNPVYVWYESSVPNQIIFLLGFVFVAMVFPLLLPAIAIFFIVRLMGEYTIVFNDQTKTVQKKKALGGVVFSIGYDKIKEFVVDEWTWYQEVQGNTKRPVTGGKILIELDGGQTIHVATCLQTNNAQSLAKSLKEVLMKKKGINPVDKPQPKKNNSTNQQINESDDKI